MSEESNAERMLSIVSSVSGYIEDVARHMIAIARHRGSTVECEYGGVLLRATADSTVEEVRSHFNHAGFARLSAYSSGWKEYLREQLIRERVRIGPRPMRALFSPGGTLAPE